LEGHFSLFLGDVAVEDLGLLFEVGLEEDLVSLLFGLAEDDRPTVAAAVEVDDVGYDGVAVVVGTVEGEVLDSFRGSDFGVFDEINEFAVGSKIGS
jgi:hypothetical protein